MAFLLKFWPESVIKTFSYYVSPVGSRSFVIQVPYASAEASGASGPCRRARGGAGFETETARAHFGASWRGKGSYMLYVTHWLQHIDIRNLGRFFILLLLLLLLYIYIF